MARGCGLGTRNEAIKAISGLAPVEADDKACVGRIQFLSGLDPVQETDDWLLLYSLGTRICTDG